MKNKIILSDIQKEFLLHFFKDERYAGWRNIAMKLLDTGKCIVAGKECIWRGGIGNFIKTKDAVDAVDCLEYSFDLSEFLSSKYFHEYHDNECVLLKEEEEKAKLKYTEVWLVGTLR